MQWPHIHDTDGGLCSGVVLVAPAVIPTETVVPPKPVLWLGKLLKSAACRRPIVVLTALQPAVSLRFVFPELAATAVANDFTDTAAEEEYLNDHLAYHGR